MSSGLYITIIILLLVLHVYVPPSYIPAQIFPGKKDSHFTISFPFLNYQAVLTEDLSLHCSCCPGENAVCPLNDLIILNRNSLKKKKKDKLKIERASYQWFSVTLRRNETMILILKIRRKEWKTKTKPGKQSTRNYKWANKPMDLSHL